MTLLPTILLLLSATGLLAVWLGFGKRRVASLCICFGVAAMLSAAGCGDKPEPSAENQPEPGEDQNKKGKQNEQGKQGEDDPVEREDESPAVALERARMHLKAQDGGAQALAYLQAIPPEYVEERRRWLREFKQTRPEQAEALQAAYDALLAYEASRQEDPQDQDGDVSLEFRVAADPEKWEALTPQIERIDEQGPGEGSDSGYVWKEVDDLAHYVPDSEQRAVVSLWLKQSLSTETSEQNEAAQAISAYFQPAHGETHGVIARPYAGRLFLLLHDTPSLAMAADDAWTVTSVKRAAGELGQPVLTLQLDDSGAKLMRAITGSNIDRPLAVVLNGKVVTTPFIRSELGNAIQISGDFSEEEMTYLLKAFSPERAGRAP